MKIEIICIGSELLRGHVNTNNAYLGEKLFEIGCTPFWESSVIDERESMKSVFVNALARADIIITTGGLGPTFDDITREVISDTLKIPLVKDEHVLEDIKKKFSKRKFKMPMNNEKMAFIFQPAKVFLNETGTAPGMILEVTFNGLKRTLCLLPGPPVEMQPMVEKNLIPYLKGKMELKDSKNIILKVTGLPESRVEELIKPILDKQRKMSRYIQFAILAHPGCVDIKIFAELKDELLLEKDLNNIKQEIRDCLTDNIYSEEDKLLEEVVAEMLIKDKMQIAAAESCTGGLLSNKFTNIAGSSAFFSEGIITYSNDAKIKYLNVLEDTLNKFGAVSKEVAMQMAKGIKENSGAEIGISITGIAGPGGATDKKPVGLVYTALCSAQDLKVKEFYFQGNRKYIKEITVMRVLDLIRRYLMDK